jgi:hypothetical protein
MLVSFIKWSGLRMISGGHAQLHRKAADSCGSLRHPTWRHGIKSVAELHALPNAQIRISSNTARTRLHAKTYVFSRNNGFSTAYVGSSNLTRPAISSGLEWNVQADKFRISRNVSEDRRHV